MYPDMCGLIDRFSELCPNAKTTATEKKLDDDMKPINQVNLEPQHQDANYSQLDSSAETEEEGMKQNVEKCVCSTIFQADYCVFNQ